MIPDNQRSPEGGPEEIHKAVEISSSEGLLIIFLLIPVIITLGYLLGNGLGIILNWMFAK